MILWLYGNDDDFWFQPSGGGQSNVGDDEASAVFVEDLVEFL